MTFGDKTIQQVLSEQEMVVISADIRSNCNKVRNAFGQMNNEAFMLPMLVLQNIKMLEEFTAMKELLAKIVENTAVAPVTKVAEKPAPTTAKKK